MLGPDYFPAPLKLIRITPALRAIATVHVGLDEVATSQLACPGEGPLPIRLVPRGAGKEIVLELADRPRIDLDPSSLPGAGAHSVRFVADIQADDPPLLVEWRAAASGDDTIQGRTLTASAPEAAATWLAPTPFAPALVWRTGAGPWSDPVGPAPDLAIQVRRNVMKSLKADGMDVTADPDHPGRWRYLPDRPGLEAGLEGRRQFSLIEAGAVAFLQATMRLDLAPARKHALLNAVLRLQPDALTVEAAPLEVDSMWIEHGKGGGTWTVLASGRSSGMPPWNAALAAQPDKDAVAAIKDALGGIKGRVRLGTRYRPRDAAKEDQPKEAYCDLVDALSER